MLSAVLAAAALSTTLSSSAAPSLTTLASTPSQADAPTAPQADAQAPASSTTSAQPDATSAAAAPPSAVAETGSLDRESPVIEDLAVAAQNPHAPPMLTAVLSDDVSGIGRAQVFFRARGEPTWRSAEFAAGEGGVFIARLPEGLQKSGFEYYVVVTDVAGNPPARLGSPERALQVPGATESVAERLERRRREEQPRPVVHPLWVMAAMGTGVLAGAGSGIFWYDWSTLNGQIADIDQNLAAPNLSDASRQALTEARLQRTEAQLQDVAIGSVLGVTAVAGLGTGVALLIVSALDE